MSNVLRPRRLEFNCDWKPIRHREQPTGSLPHVPLSRCWSPVRLSVPFMPTLERWTRITIQSMLFIKEVNSALPQCLRRESRGRRSSVGCCSIRALVLEETNLGNRTNRHLTETNTASLSMLHTTVYMDFPLGFKCF